MPVERPPILQGSAEQQLAALRDYLFRLAGSLENVQSAPVYTAGTMAQTGTGGINGSGSGTSAATEEKIRQNARELKGLIIKTANTITHEMNSREEEYKDYFLAQSEFGEFEENLDLRIETNARNVVEGYNYASAIRTAQNSADKAKDYYNQISGEIRRGFLNDPDHHGETVFGIAISSSLRFTGAQPVERDGSVYYELEERQTFGLYTATGWQFWINGHKAGWFNVGDGMLHVANVYVEENLHFGDKWRARKTGADEFEIVYVGV